MPAIRIQLCGPFAVEVAGRRVDDALPGRQGKLLTAFLATNPNRPLTRDDLAAALWGDHAPADPDATLNPLISRIRRVLGPDRLPGRTDIRFVDTGDTFVEAMWAVDAVHRAEALIVAERWADAVQPGHTAYQIANRPFMAGHRGAWIDEWRRCLEDVRCRGLECYARGALCAEALLTAAEMGARRLIEVAPFRESGYALLMDVMERRGNRAEALVLYERVRCLLRDELGVAPGAELQRRHLRLLRAASGAS